MSENIERRVKLQSILQRWVACTLDMEVADKELAELYKPQNVAFPMSVSSNLISGLLLPSSAYSMAGLTTKPRP